MENKNGSVRLYNVMFPIWMLILFPSAWLAVFPVNFIVDSLVLIICMSKLGIVNRWQTYKTHILKIFAFGMIADLIGAGLLLLVVMLDLGFRGDEIFLTLPAMLISALFIFIFNHTITFKGMDKRLRFKLALTYAIVTAPYTFLIPLEWIYGF